METTAGEQKKNKKSPHRIALLALGQKCWILFSKNEFINYNTTVCILK